MADWEGGGLRLEGAGGGRGGWPSRTYPTKPEAEGEGRWGVGVQVLVQVQVQVSGPRLSAREEGMSTDLVQFVDGCIRL